MLPEVGSSTTVSGPIFPPPVPHRSSLQRYGPDAVRRVEELQLGDHGAVDAIGNTVQFDQRVLPIRAVTLSAIFMCLLGVLLVHNPE